VTTYKLHGYQETASAFVRGVGRGLFMDMGLGKTAITLSALEPRHLPALVVAPKRVAENVWPDERPKWRPDLELTLAAGSPQQRAQVLDHRGDVTVISKDNIDDLIGRKPYRTVIFDELSVYKGRGVRFKTARKIAMKAEYTWGLTGTPAPNGYLDLWPQVGLLDKGQRLGKSIGPYRERWFKSYGRLPNGVLIDWRPLPGAEEEIRSLIQDICLYMSADDELDLPPVTVNPVVVKLPSAVANHYSKMKNDLVLDIEMLGFETYSASNSGVLAGKLAQLATGFLYSDRQDKSYTWFHDTKLAALQEIVDGTGDNLLVFYNYIPEREKIRAAFPQARLLDEPDVISAWSRGEVPMMLAHPASAGHGLNLQTGGHTIVWVSPTWDLELYLQGNKRLDRQGQTQPVIIHVIQTQGTVETQMARRLEKKEAAQFSLLDHLRSPM